MDLDNVNTALNLATKATDFQWELLEMQAEPLWRLGRYDDLDNLLKKAEMRKSKSWGVQMGNALMNLKNGKRKK